MLKLKSLPNNHKSVMQKETEASLIFSGIISTRIISVKGCIPNDEMKIDQEKLATGIQLNVSTSTSNDFSVIYEPRVIKPNAVPMHDNTSMS